MFVGSVDLSVYAVTAEGRLKWSFSTGAEVFASPTVGDDGTVFVGSWDGKMYALCG